VSVCVCVCAPCEANWRYFRDRSCLVKAFFFLRASHYLKIAGQLCAPHSSKNKTAQTRPPLFFILSQVSHCRQNYFASVCFSVSSIRANPRALSREIYFQSKSRRRSVGTLCFLFYFGWLLRTTSKGEQPEPVRVSRPEKF
jgi:hypothetical protein